MSIFTADQFQFPYLYRFPGQGSDEIILFVTRESPVMKKLRLLGVATMAVATVVVGWWLASLLNQWQLPAIGSISFLVSVVAALGMAGIGWWWFTTLWEKSIGIVTNRRLIKFIYTSPFNRHSLSLPLEMIVDTGAYNKGWWQAMFKLGTFVARSSASSSGAATDDPSRVNKKYFYIENINFSEDLQHYLTKVLHSFRTKPQELASFRPFIPHLKGEQRKEFMKQYPEYWS
jgi:hypothetical protein